MKQVNGFVADSFRRRVTRWRGACITLSFFFLFLDCQAADPRWRLAVFPSGASVTLEIAADPAAHARGYMFRERVGAGEGMLFIFDAPDLHPFWMKNCKVGLDIIWLDAQFNVVDIAHDRKPCPELGDCPSVVPMRAAQYVLEVAAGTARREGLERGDALVMLAEPPGS